MTREQVREFAAELTKALGEPTMAAIKADLGNHVASGKSPPSSFAELLFDELMHPAGSEGAVIPNPIGLL